MDSKSFEDLVALFNIERKQEAQAHCRKIVINSDELAEVLLAARIAGLGPYIYAYHFAQSEPETLVPSTEELNALGRSAVGTTLSGKALAAVRKIDQMYEDRRLLASHLFYSRSHRHWHLFDFDQRDYQATGNHWKHGPHIHYSRESFTREPLREVWRKVCLPKPEFPRSVHVRYDYHHNRRRSG